MRLFTDNPITRLEEDRYGFAPYATMLRDVIIETSNLPFCIGIFGAWGAGKSSLMKMIQDLLTQQSGLRTIWFNPWKYDRKEEIWNALIQTILHQIINERSIDNPQVLDKAKELGKSLTWIGLKKTITTVSGGFITEENLQKLIDAFEKRNELLYRHLNQFEESFAEVVKDYTDGSRLVVFIDDLDRCLPENAVTVLESIKLFMGHASCIFVVGMDHQVIEAGIRLRFADKINLDGRDYLDKIIQVPFYLPPVPFERLKSTLAAEELAVNYSQEVWEIVQLGMDGNPRKTKRFVNCFALLRRIMEQSTLHDQHLPGLRVDDSKLPDPVTYEIYLAKLLVLQISFPEFYAYLRLHPSDWEYLEEKIILVDDGSRREQALKDRPTELERIWHNPYFQGFMRRTARSVRFGFPKAPNESQVQAMLQMVRLVTATPLPSGPDSLQDQG